MKICIFGLGYVGTVSAACLANFGHQVVGTDVNPIKVNMIKSGSSPIVEEKIDELVASSVREGHLTATTNAAEALDHTDLVIICVGTPNEDNGSHALQSIKATCEKIGRNMASMGDYPVIVLRSTVIPGTTESVVIPILEEVTGKKAGQDFGVCFNPEFLREGTSIYDFHNPPYTVIGATDEKAYQRVAEVYQAIPAPIYPVDIRVAEMIKMVCNAFHAMKVVFANEIGNICKGYNIDSHKVMDLVTKDTKLNISPAYLKPGFAFGGSCLPKDIKALLYMGHNCNLEMPVLESILPSNNLQVEMALNMVMKTGKKRVSVLGLSFKEGTDDLRFSPQVELAERLIGKGYQVNIYDQNVSLARLIGANKAYIEKEIPHISSLLTPTLDEAVEKSDVIIISNKDKQFASVFEKIRQDQVIIDLVRISEDFKRMNGQYKGLGW